MVIAYLLSIVTLAGLWWISLRRASRLYRRYENVVAKLEEVLTQATNLNVALDPVKAALSQYKMCALAAQREKLENKYTCWQIRADALGETIKMVKGWRGKMAPYIVGICDTICGLTVLEGFGINVSVLIATVTAPVLEHLTFLLSLASCSLFLFLTR